MLMPFSFRLSIIWLSTVAAFSSTPNNYHDDGVISGGDQYIHNENSDRQYLLHQCFRQSSGDALEMSGILRASKNQNSKIQDSEPYRMLEIGCGAGHTTLDLLAKILPENAKITAVDADASMVATAKARLLKQESTQELGGRVDFLHKTGETMAEEMPGQFDAVWIRFVIVHVPDPIALLQAAVACLKPGGILLVEDTYTTGTSSLCDPPFYAHELFHRAHAKATRKLGGDLTRGSRIGSYLTDLGLGQVSCNSFAPIFARGINIHPWTSTSAASDDSTMDISSKQKFEFGWKLLKGSLRSLIPKLRELEVCTEEELTKPKKV